ncbi:MAG: Ni/Fe-hydrogenase cytochrome b subunit [Nitrospirae bacterium]|nr:MAG: Ni/Fe-hydrogenase cytochrome b subunit [Nitrospirota bacterium]
MTEAKPIGGKIFTKPFLVCAFFVAIAGILIIKRYIFGIGAVSNLSDGYPWGIWIAYDVVVGTAIACGGYSMALLVYIFNKGEYHALVRPALLASAFGYTLAGASIFVDIGRYWQAYNLFLPWYSQLNSVMFEVAFCISLYIFVLWIEYSPVFAEWIDAKGLRNTLNRVMFIFIAIGVLLPTMHQSSLGSLMLIAGKKVSPLWQTGFIPLLFLISAITMGYSIVIFESIVSSVGFRREIETPILSKVAGLIPVLIGIYMVVRFGDLIVRGKLGLAFAFDLKSVMFIIENILYIIPAIILASPQNRVKTRQLFIASALMLLAGAVYRFNAFLIGFDPGPGWQYFPSFSEIMITLGVISVEIMAYMIFVKKMPVLPSVRHA